MDALKDEGAAALKDASVAARLRSTSASLKEAQALLAQQHRLLQEAVLSSPAGKGAARSPSLDPEDAWVLRNREQELEQLEAKLRTERDEVLERSLELQQERDELNVRKRVVVVSTPTCACC